MGHRHSHVVVGAGALGSATAYWLTRAGVGDVLVLEQYHLGHGRGASEDHSRIMRHAYHSSVYTALTQAAYDAWADIEDETGLQLVLKTGGLDLAVAGTAGETELGNYRRSLMPFGIPSQDLDAGEVRRRWPVWRIGDDVVGLYQQDGGILDIRRGTAAHIALARRGGARFQPHTKVRGISPRAHGVSLSTGNGTVEAGHVVLCVASWLPDLLGDLGLRWRLTLSQEQVSYFATPHARDFAPGRFPVWMWHGDSVFYGFPVYGEVAVKAARGMTGRFVTQETRSFEPDRSETDLVASFLRERLPAAAGPSCTAGPASTTCRPTATSSSTTYQASRRSRSASAPGTRPSSRACSGRSSPTWPQAAAPPTRSATSARTGARSPIPGSNRSSAWPARTAPGPDRRARASRAAPSAAGLAQPR